MNSDPDTSPQGPEPDPAPLRPSREGALFEWPPGVPELVERHWRALFFKAYKAVGDEDAAAEIAQDTIIGFLKAPRGYAESTLYEPRLRWAIKSWLRRERKHRAVALEKALNELERIAASGPDALAKVVVSHEYQRALAALTKLTPNDQDLLDRRYLRGETIGEIADALDIDEGTARTRLHRARKRLRDLLKES